MKKIFVFVSVLSILIVSCFVQAFAAETVDGSVPQSTYDALNSQYNQLLQDYENLESDYALLQTAQVELQSKYDKLESDFNALKNQSYSTSGLDEGVEQSDESMSGIVSAIFGTYSPKTQTVSQTLENGTVVTSQEIIPGVAGMDWHWIAGVLLFSIVLWSFFRFLGVIFKHG